MMSLSEQVATGKLVCPKSRKPLFFDETDSFLVTADGSSKYLLLDGSIPVLLADEELAGSYTAGLTAQTAQAESFLNRVKLKLVRDHRSDSSIAAFRSIIEDAPGNALCLAIGGGPTRLSANLVNLNIDPSPGVDVIADAHSLPYADNSVDVIDCEAVLEHLRDPNLAATEMYRVLKPGGKVLAITPFLQPYHGYPHHYQNFTLKGHVHLFQSKGFQINESGTCVGPTFALTILIYNYIFEYLPLGKLLSQVFAATALLVTPLDRFINRKPESHIVASTTYVVASKVGV